MLKKTKRIRKNESVGDKRWFVLDLNTTEECDSLEDAIDKAEWWIQLQKDQLEDADDEEVARWYRAGDQGLDTGDVEVYEVDADDEDILDYNGRVSGIEIMNNYEPVEVFSGFAVTEEEAEKRKLESRRLRDVKTFKEEREKTDIEKKLGTIIELLLGNRDFNSLASCRAIRSFYGASYMLNRIKNDLDKVDDRCLLSDTYIDMQTLRGDLKLCLEFLTALNPRYHFGLGEYKYLVDSIKKSISMLEK